MGYLDELLKEVAPFVCLDGLVHINISVSFSISFEAYGIRVLPAEFQILLQHIHYSFKYTTFNVFVDVAGCV